MTKKQLMTFLILAVTTLVSTESLAQSINFNYTDGSSASYALQDVRRVDFTGVMMNLHLNDGTVYSWNISSVGYYEYDGLPLKIEDWLGKVNERQVKVFPNPASGEQTLALLLPNEEQLQMRVYDALGIIVLERDLGRLSKGEHIFPIGLNEAVGNYTLLLYNAKFSVSKKLIRIK